MIINPEAFKKELTKFISEEFTDSNYRGIDIGKYSLRLELNYYGLKLTIFFSKLKRHAKKRRVTDRSANPKNLRMLSLNKLKNYEIFKVSTEGFYSTSYNWFFINFFCRTKDNMINSLDKILIILSKITEILQKNGK